MPTWMTCLKSKIGNGIQPKIDTRPVIHDFNTKTVKIKYPISDVSNLTVDEVLDALQTDCFLGISVSESTIRGNRFGLNAHQAKKKKSTWSMLVGQFKSAMVYLLLIAAGVSFYFEDNIEATSILIVIFVNALIGFFMELQARSSMRALRKMDVSLSNVIRGGKPREISSENLVPGDLVLLEAGDLVAADGRIVECNQFSCDESSLTGESFPVMKNLNVISGDVELGDCLNMVFKGTAVIKGNARFVVTGISVATELGKISLLVDGSSDTVSPLDKKLSSLTKKLIWITVGMTGIFAISGLIQGRSWMLVLETSIALAVAAFPEGLPIVATVALSYGMLMMARKNAIVKNLAAVETLGGVNVILTDKTGTLTENKIHAARFCFADEELSVSIEKGVLNYQSDAGPKHVQNLDRMVIVGVLCNNVRLEETEASHKLSGDPVEVALIELAKATGLDLLTTQKSYERVSEVPFSSETKLMGTLHGNGSRFYVSVKGAVEELLVKCSRMTKGPAIAEISQEDRKATLLQAENMAADGLRVLAFAYAETDNRSPGENFIKELVYVGMIGFLDPPRLDIRPSILACKKAGIKIVMITGDHPLTALNIATRIGMLDEGDTTVMVGKELPCMNSLSKTWKEKILATAVFARTTPKQKLEIVEIYQRANFIVAMTGDGVNDAPALKKADIGIAMGQRGTQVAKETASIILKDDSFTSVAGAVSRGREIFQNIQRFVIYLVSCNLSEILIVTIIGFVASGAILLPMQILFLNMVTDVFPALALGLGRGDKTVMLKPPRDPAQEIITNKNWVTIFIYASLITLSVLGAVFYCKYFISSNPKMLNNVAFVTLAFSQLFHVFNMSSPHSGLWINEVTKNKFVWMALVLCSVLVLSMYAFGPTRYAIELTLLTIPIWLLSLLASLLPLLLVQSYKVISVQFKMENEA